MKTYTKFFISIFFKSLFFVFFIILSLVFILNLLSELDFFKDLDVNTTFPLLLALLNSPATIMEMFPFVFLLTTQLFFIRLFENNEIDIFKYSGLKNSRILVILAIISFISGLVIISLFYNFSSSLKNIHLDLKSKYSIDGKYLAVITKNGLWIKDKINNKILLINSTKIEKNYLIENFITEFDQNYSVIRNIKSNKIDVSKKNWLIHDAKIYRKNDYKIEKYLNLETNFDYKRIQTLYSNLSSLNFLELYELKQNYKKLNYSVTDVNLQMLKLISFPFYFLLMTIFSSIIMLKIKHLNSITFKISIGLFFSVIIYYINNFFYVLGSTEKMTLTIAVFLPLLILTLTNSIMLYKINEK